MGPDRLGGPSIVEGDAVHQIPPREVEVRNQVPDDICGAVDHCL